MRHCPAALRRLPHRAGDRREGFLRVRVSKPTRLLQAAGDPCQVSYIDSLPLNPERLFIGRSFWSMCLVDGFVPQNTSFCLVS